MSDDDVRKRLADQEAFKYQIVGDQARITTKVEILYDMVKAEFDAGRVRMSKLDEKIDRIDEKHDKHYGEIEKAIAGSLTRPGILEQNRNLGKDLAKLGGIITLSGFLLWKVISPIYDAWVNRWIPQRIANTVAAESETKSSKLVRRSLKPAVATIDTDSKKQ